jgi:hypothetical protein
MKKKMGIIEKDLRVSLTKYKEDKNLHVLLRSIACQADHHCHYYWQFRFFQRKLEVVYKELMSNENPSHREGRVDAVSSG